MIYTEFFQPRRQAGEGEKSGRFISTVNAENVWPPAVTLLDIKTMTEPVKLPSSLLPSCLTNLVLHRDGAGEVTVVLGGEVCHQAALLARHHRHRRHPELLCWDKI